LIFTFIIIGANGSMPCPFARILYFQQHSLMRGDDVFMLQNLIKRSPFVKPSFIPTGTYDRNTTHAVSSFQQGNGLALTGIFEQKTAETLLKLHLYDNYRDNGTIPAGYKYKVHVPVHKDRNIESTATLYDDHLNVLHTFTVRTHGQNDPKTNKALNMLCDSGNTPTGLMTFDLNSPEDDPVDFGPYPVNRAVQGLEGNANIIISDIRDGILMHTGEWPHWNSSMPMPNSHGCIHGHPEDINKVWKILVSIGVQIRPNTDGKLPYPYPPQGILSVEQID